MLCWSAVCLRETASGSGKLLQDRLQQLQAEGREHPMVGSSWEEDRVMPGTQGLDASLPLRG